MHLTERERQIVTLLRREPTISPAAIAEQLGSSRASVNVHLSNLGKKGVILGRGYLLSESPGVVVVGGANVDVKARSTAPATPETSNPGQASMTPGGVGRNIAENLARLGTRTHLVSVVGRDALGDTLLSQTAASGVRLEHVTRTDVTTGTYTAVLDADGELVIAVAAMAATDELGPERVDAARDLIATAELVVVDGNVWFDALEHALELAAAAQVRAIVEPVSVPKARALSPCLTPERPLFAITPNRDELAALTDLPTGTDRQVARAAASLHDSGVELVWVRLGERGSVLSRAGAEPVSVPAVPTRVEDVTGAGDAALAAFCHALLSGEEPESAARFGHAAASLTIASTHTVRPDLTDRLVRSTLGSSVQKPRA
jgi:pseudouridine kinase